MPRPGELTAPCGCGSVNKSLLSRDQRESVPAGLRQNSGMRCLLLLVTSFALAAAGEMPLTVEKLTDFIRSAVQLKQPDKQVAETLRHFRMVEKLDDRKIEVIGSWSVPSILGTEKP